MGYCNYNAKVSDWHSGIHNRGPLYVDDILERSNVQRRLWEEQRKVYKDLADDIRKEDSLSEDK